MVTVEDLRWWLALAGDVEWTFARTYAKTAPHSYVVLDRAAGLTRDDFVRAAHVIHTFGQPAKFYSMTSIYLTSPDGRLKWWTMDKDLNDTTLINQATTERLYGVQNAPSTVSGIRTPYDEIATSYDERHPIEDTEARALSELVAPFKSEYPTSVLDIGCGTGRVLDLGLATLIGTSASTRASRCSTCSSASTRVWRGSTRRRSSRHSRTAPSRRASSRS